MTTVPLFKEATAFLSDDGTGTGRCTAQLGPEKYGDTWQIKLMTTMNPATTTDVQLRVYRNSETMGNMVDSTYSGRQDTSPCDITLRNGEKLIFVWTKGDIGTQCVARVEGDLISGRFA